MIWTNLSDAFLKCSIYFTICFVCLFLWPHWPVLHQLCCALGSQGWNKSVHLARIPLLQHLLSEGATSLSRYCSCQHLALIFPSSALTQGVKASITDIMFISVAACRDVGKGSQGHRSSPASDRKLIGLIYLYTEDVHTNLNLWFEHMAEAIISKLSEGLQPYNCCRPTLH